MRIIKFRAWDNHKGAWCKDGEILLTLDGDWRSNFGEHEDGIELQQFTGLLDKNEKEIYEGDIVKSRTGIKKIELVISQFDNILVRQSASGWIIDIDCEVIGNVWENPELIK